ncbi:MAG: carboxysome shell carbonic anhydrase [Chromatiaceae bacterium]|nr:carboxysome shell carbonic anhydrase [Chromatiaceae bacterium]MCP5307099.1 carboxysome shell carbonic anhydrase [Chromatiaceae bacterium]MCP5423261.1 carboxysome shell carbonic anhydrase [Chromatiaceae bacterium]
MQRAFNPSTGTRARAAGTAPLRRPGAVGGGTIASHPHAQAGHVLCRERENARLYDYERGIKSAFDAIVPTLKRVSALQHEEAFESLAQDIARRELGFELPRDILSDAWVEQLDMRRLFAWCVFATYRRYCDEFFASDPLALDDRGDFDAFLQSCGFHTLDISPCADGRLAHVIRYVLRLPHRAVRRKSYAGALFDIEDSIQKWVETEMLRFREGRPNTADAPTRYLKTVAYHFSSVDPQHQGCAAHGSDDTRAATAGLNKLLDFQRAIQNSFCCGASIDLLLIGVDTDTDAIRVHVPDGNGVIELDRFVDALELFDATARQQAAQAVRAIDDAVRNVAADVAPGMAQLIARLIENNVSQIAYVRGYHGRHYADIGHAERFIGAGVGFEEIQLRNLMYFAYLDTVEEATQDLDVGIKIFTGLNVSHGLPVPIVVRFDYHGQVPGARDRAIDHCQRVTDALQTRYADLSGRGMLHVMQVVRDCSADAAIEVLECTVNAESKAGAH